MDTTTHGRTSDTRKLLASVTAGILLLTIAAAGAYAAFVRFGPRRIVPPASRRVVRTASVRAVRPRPALRVLEPTRSPAPTAAVSAPGTQTVSDTTPTADEAATGGQAARGKVVALTFDDGPWPVQTEQVLRILQQNHVRATFFEVGEEVRAHPDLTRKVLAAGMVVGDHTETHANLTKLDRRGIESEITLAASDLEKITGKSPVYFRPPGGDTNGTVWGVVRRLGLKLVQWDVDTNDWQKPAPRVIVSRVLAGVRPGAVVLMHDGGGDRSRTIAALPDVIKGLKARGYTFVTVDELAKLPTHLG